MLSFNTAFLVQEQQIGPQAATAMIRLTQPKVVVKTASKCYTRSSCVGEASMSDMHKHSKSLIVVLGDCFPLNEGSRPFSALDFTHAYGSVAGALLYLPIFWPDFLVVDDSIILDSGDKDLSSCFRTAKESWTKGLEQLEETFNWREVPYLFSQASATQEQSEILARAIAEMWRMRLQGLFPQKTFLVKVLSSTDTGGEIGVGFKAVRSGPTN